MPTDHIVALLIAERDRLNRAIEALQGPVKRRGRPPRNPDVIATATAIPRARKGMSKAARKAQSARMKKYWAAKRKNQSAA
jgi:DNA-binding phage protein